MALLGAFAVPRAPARVAIHWDLAGHPNGYADPLSGLLGLPVYALILYVVMRLAPRLDPRRARYARFAGAYAALRLGTTALLAVSQWIIVTTALGRHPDVAMLSALAVGLFLLLTGAVLRRLPPNAVAGVRTPWTRRSPRVWVATQRQAGRLLTLLGLVTVAAGVAGVTRAVVVPVVGALVVGSLGLIAYSYLAWKLGSPSASP